MEDDGQFYMSYNDFIKAQVGFTAVDVTSILGAGEDQDHANTENGTQVCVSLQRRNYGNTEGCIFQDAVTTLFSEKIKWAEDEEGYKYAFAMKLGRTSTKVTIQIRQENADDPGVIEGKTTMLLVCTWRNGCDFIAGSVDEMPILCSDLRTADIG